MIENCWGFGFLVCLWLSCSVGNIELSYPDHVESPAEEAGRLNRDGSVGAESATSINDGEAP